jgi:ribonucleoside-triphosphate reductase
MSESSIKLSEITTYMKYSRYLKEKNKRENWEEIINRNITMHINKFPDYEAEIRENYKYVYEKKILPSMRSLQMGGNAILKHNNRMYNCCYLPIRDTLAFPEIFFLLLCGCGVGFSVQTHHVNKLPVIKRANNTKVYLINDTIESWADSIKYLLNGYFDLNEDTERFMPIFDFSLIRKKGEILKTTGGYAPGPEPLKQTILKITDILDKKKDGNKLSSLECHDIICHLADAVYAGGIRRAALISLFTFNDEKMLNCKSGDIWYKNEQQRFRSNNSAVLLRKTTTQEDFNLIFNKVKESGSGEPGIYFTNDLESGTNPCCEVALNSYQFCNLTEMNCSTIDSQEELNNRAKAASFIATLQATYTDFTYLRPEWKSVTEKEALLGVSLTGLAKLKNNDFDFKIAAEKVKSENEKWALKLGINKAARTTCIKPAGTTSLIFGCSSGIHPYYDLYYIRRLRIGKEEQIYNYLKQTCPLLIEDDVTNVENVAVLSIPIESPKDSILRNEKMFEFLNRIKKFYNSWILNGHNTGVNTHNISATISVKDTDWDYLKNWMWENKTSYNGLSILPYSDFVYDQLPFEECSKETFESLLCETKKINLSDINEHEYHHNFEAEIACSGGACEMTRL